MAQEILEYNICLVPVGAEYINPDPDAIESSKMGMSSAVSYNTVTVDGVSNIYEIAVAILPEGWKVLQEGEIWQYFISICKQGEECKCGRGAQRDDVQKWWWYLERNVFDWLGLNFKIKKTRKLIRAQVSSTETGLLYNMEFARIPLQPGED